VGTDGHGNQYVRFVSATCSVGAAACVELRRVAPNGRVLAFAPEPIGAEVVDYYVTPGGAAYELRNDRAPGGAIAGIFVIRLLGPLPTATAAVPVCPGQTPILDVATPPPPGDAPGTGSPDAQAAFRRANPRITDFTMFPLGSDQPTTAPGTGSGPVWIVAGNSTFIALAPGAPGPNNWFAYPARFMGCR
jgi:hypothetical protein